MTLLKWHFGIGVPQKICCIFLEQLFIRAYLYGCFWVILLSYFNFYSVGDSAVSFFCIVQVPFVDSHQRCSIKKSYLKNFTKFTGKHLCQSLLFNKVAGLGPATLLKRDAGTGVFKNNCFIEHLQMTLSASTLAQLAKLSQWKKNLLDQILLIWKLNYVILKNWWSRLIALPNPFIHNVEKWYF